MAKAQGIRRAAFKAAFPYTVPIFAGFWFLGLTYGIYMNTMGFSWVYPTLMAALIFGGSLEFIVVSMLLSPFAPVTALLVTLAVQARHLFYGVSMLDKYRGTGWMKPFLIFGMCDETFSILYTAEAPEGVDRRWFMFFVTLLDYSYWVSGSFIGGVAGSFVTFDTEGLSFVMTALFVVIFLEQWMKERRHWTAFVGFAASIACLAVFGAGGFMLPTLACMLVALTLLRKPMGKRFLAESEAAIEVAAAEPGSESAPESNCPPLPDAPGCSRTGSACSEQAAIGPKRPTGIEGHQEERTRP